MKAVIHFLLILLSVSACEFETTIKESGPQRYVLNAAFVSGEPLPTVTVGRSFSTTGASGAVIPSTEFQVLTADVTLLRAGQLHRATHTGEGRYSFGPADTVCAGETFLLSAKIGVEEVWAETTVPIVDTTGVHMFPSRSSPSSPLFLIRRDSPDPRRPVFDRFLELEYRLNYRQNFVTPFVAVGFRDSRSDSLSLIYEMPEKFLYPKPIRMFGRSFKNLTIMQGAASLFIPIKETSKASPLFVKVNMELRYPDDFYASYASLYSDGVVPVTATNVRNGIGLVVGIAKFNRSVSLRVQ